MHQEMYYYEDVAFNIEKLFYLGSRTLWPDWAI